MPCAGSASALWAEAFSPERIEVEVQLARVDFDDGLGNILGLRGGPRVDFAFVEPQGPGSGPLTGLKAGGLPSLKMLAYFI